MESKLPGGGRGRGRGRTLTAQDPPPAPPGPSPSAPDPEPEEPPHAERYEAVAQEPPVAVVEPFQKEPAVVPQQALAGGLGETYDAMYVAPREGAFPGESDRGRSRGRGAGRGRPDAGRGAAAAGGGGEPAYMGGAAGGQRSPPHDHGEKFADDPELPGTPPEAAGVTPVQSSPESVIAEGVNVEDVAATLQNASLQSGHGSTVTTVVQEKPVINRSGTKGDPVEMKTNYLRLKLLPGHRGLVEYHVSIQPSVEDVKMRRNLIGTEQAAQVLGKVKSFDGMILFLPHILERDVTVFSTCLREDTATEYKIKVTFVKIRPMGDCIVFFNILLNRILRQLNYKEIKREFYDLDMRIALDQHKLEIWPGTNLCTENQEDGLMICVDTTNRVLRQETVLTHLHSLQGQGPKAKALFEEFIINKIVITKYNYKCYKIDEVAWDMQPSSTFVHRGKEVTFKEYLKRYPDVVITDMKQPMLMSKLKPRKNETVVEGQGERLAALVPECCYITGLTEDQKQNFKVMTSLAESTRITPAQRVTNLDRFINRILSNDEVKAILGNWGMCIERNIIEVIGRRVDGPNLQFAKGSKPLMKAPPDFSRESSRGVYEPIATRKFVVICTVRDQDKAKAFMKCYQEFARTVGINMTQAGDIYPLKGMNPTHFSEALKQVCPKPDSVHFVVIIMPMQRDDVYSAIKRYCVSNVPVPSQCIVSKTLGNEKRLKSIVTKIALQINCKLGGALWAMQMPLKEDVMFIGIDAAHDPLKKDASVMCLVASLNNECTKYFSKSSTSKVHQELADSLSTLTKDALHMFSKHRGKFPERIIVFRDGGSMGALEQMEATEAAQMKKAAFEVCGEELKNFTFTVVTKRIPQRFFAKVGRNQINNPAPGSIVDSIVTRRHHYDFYIVSQQVGKGTVNPTHFVILDTEDPIRPDLIQRFAYVTCFQYFNWPGTVRVPAMVQYAHKLSALLIRHVKAAPHRDISTTLYYL